MSDMNDQQKRRFNGIAAFLDLPIGSAISLDAGVVEILLKRDDFVGFTHLPSQGFHLITVRAARPPQKQQQQEQQQSSPFCATTVGFVLPTSTSAKTSGSAEPAAAVLVRRYDPQTEEVSSTPPDDLTVSNLVQQIQTGRIYPLERLLAYPQVVASSSSTQSGTDRAKAWQENLSNFISPRLLEKRGIHAGLTKLVPGTYEEDGTDDTSATTGKQSQKSTAAIEDGTSISYPAIPVVSMNPREHQQHQHRLVNHVGTKRFLARLSPAQRTQIFSPSSSSSSNTSTPADVLLRLVLEQEYDNHWQDLLGDLQLSYVVFLQLRCYSSLEHWRDVLAMLSMVSVDLFLLSSDDNVAPLLLQLYTGLLQVLSSQVRTMENDFFENLDFSGGNFFGPCNQRLLNTLETVLTKSSPKGNQQHQQIMAELARLVESYRDLLQHRLPALSLDGSDDIQSEINNSQQQDKTKHGRGGDILMLDADDNEDDFDDDEDEDGPVVVSLEEMDATLERLQREERQQRQRHQVAPRVPADTMPKCHQEQYPILFAAIMPHEDVLMTCARALDQASDVSLVREAAAYLEQVEARRRPKEKNKSFS